MAPEKELGEWVVISYEHATRSVHINLDLVQQLQPVQLVHRSAAIIVFREIFQDFRLLEGTLSVALEIGPGHWSYRSYVVEAPPVRPFPDRSLRKHFAEGF